MKEIIFVTPNLANGGAERVTAVLAEELTRIGNKVMMAYMKDDVTVYSLGGEVDRRLLFSDTGNQAIRILKKIWRLRSVIKTHPQATIVAMLPYETLYTFLASIGLKNRKVYSLRNDPANMKGRLHRLIQEWIYPRADAIVFQTPDAMRFFPDRVQKKGVIIPNPISAKLPEPYDGVRQREIVTVGRLTEQKNYPLLLRAFARVHEKHPDWKLSIFGQGKLETELKTLSSVLGISEAVTFCGFVADVPDRIRKSGVFVMASDYEGISNAMLEALAVGLPCICTDCPVGGARMFIKDGVNGLLTPVGDEEKLVQAMLHYIENPDAAALAAKEAVKIRTELSAEAISEGWKEVL